MVRLSLFCAQLLSCELCLTLCRLFLSMEFFRQEYWSMLPFPSYCKIKKEKEHVKQDKILVEHLFKKNNLNLKSNYFLEGRLLCYFLL